VKQIKNKINGGMSSLNASAILTAALAVPKRKHQYKSEMVDKLILIEKIEN
jgi:hypothetical protein